MEQAVNNYGVKLAMSGNTTVTEERSGVVIKSDAVPGQTTPHLLDSLKKAPPPKSTEKKMVVVSTGTNNVWIEGYDVPTQMKDIQSVIDILSMSAPNALIVVMQPPTVFEKRYGVDVESRLRMFRQKLALLLKDPKNAHVRLLFEQSEDGSIPELIEDDFQKDPSGKPDLHLVPRGQDGILRGNEKAANKLAKLGLMRATNPQITYIPTIFK